MCDKLQGLNELQIMNITNCCGRVLTSSKPFEGIDDESMNDMVMPKCHFARPNYVGPYQNELGQLVFKPISEYKLFVKDEKGNDICLSDVNQGMIGDCWFLSALDFSINHPIWNSKLKENVEQVSENMIKIKLYDVASNQWVETFVDTRLLVSGSSGATEGSTILQSVVSVLSKQPEEIWSAMLEKGLAKMCGGYQKIEGGWMSEGMCFLHGGRGFFISSHEIVPKLLEKGDFLDRLVQDLKYLFDKGYGLFTAWEKDVFTSVREKGLVDSHAYSILDIKQIDGEWVFKIMNPWGKFEWTGKYSDNDMSEHAIKVRECMQETICNDGIFLMNAYDIFGRCEGFDIYEPLYENVISSLQ
jgi:hypothetical protein